MLSWKNTKCREQQSQSITITAPAAGEGSVNCFGPLPARSPTGDDTAPSPAASPRLLLCSQTRRARGSAERFGAPGTGLVLGKVLAVPKGILTPRILLPLPSASPSPPSPCEEGTGESCRDTDGAVPSPGLVPRAGELSAAAARWVGAGRFSHHVHRSALAGL